MIGRKEDYTADVQEALVTIEEIMNKAEANPAKKLIHTSLVLRGTNMKAHFEPHKSASGAIRYIFSRMEVE